MIILDTNVISEVFRSRPDERVLTWLESLTGEIAITAITLAELLTGVQRLPDGQRKQALQAHIDAAIEPYRDSRAILAFDGAAAAHFANIVVAREKVGRPISMADAQIAAICRQHGATCATRNTKDFTATGVDVFDPWSA